MSIEQIIITITSCLTAAGISFQQIITYIMNKINHFKEVIQNVCNEINKGENELKYKFENNLEKAVLCVNKVCTILNNFSEKKIKQICDFINKFYPTINGSPKVSYENYRTLIKNVLKNYHNE